MITRLLCLAVCVLGCSSCSSYKAVQVDGKTPIYEFESQQLPQMMAVIVATADKYEEEVKALELKPGERQSGTAEFGIGFKGASGTDPDGRLADGYVILDKRRIRARDKNSDKACQAQALIDRALEDILKGLNSISEPVYVDKFVFD